MSRADQQLETVLGKIELEEQRRSPGRLYELVNESESHPLINYSLFNWNAGALQWHKGSTEFPFSKQLPQKGPGARVLAANSHEEIKKTVAVCLDLIEPDLGDISGRIASELNIPVAEKELALLPKNDWMHPYWTINRNVREMLQAMIPRAQREHAHQLAVDGKMDVRITWNCPPPECPGALDYSLKRCVLMTPHELNVLQKAWNYHYKEYNTASREMHRLLTTRKQAPMVEKGGFYAVVPRELYQELVKLAQPYDDRIQVTPVIPPKVLSSAAQEEMQNYHQSRAIASQQLLDRKKAEAEAAEKERKDKEHRERRQNTLSAARAKEFNTQKTVDLRSGALAEPDTGLAWNHWIKTKTMTDWYSGRR